MPKKTILIYGGLGLIGYHLTRALSPKYKVICIVRTIKSGFYRERLATVSSAGAKVIESDVIARDDFKKYKPDVCINLIQTKEAVTIGNLNYYIKKEVDIHQKLLSRIAKMHRPITYLHITNIEINTPRGAMCRLMDTISDIYREQKGLNIITINMAPIISNQFNINSSLDRMLRAVIEEEEDKTDFYSSDIYPLTLTHTISSLYQLVDKAASDEASSDVIPSRISLQGTESAQSVYYLPKGNIKVIDLVEPITLDESDDSLVPSLSEFKKVVEDIKIKEQQTLSNKTSRELVSLFVICLLLFVVVYIFYKAINIF